MYAAIGMNDFPSNVKREKPIFSTLRSSIYFDNDVYVGIQIFIGTCSQTKSSHEKKNTSKKQAYTLSYKFTDFVCAFAA